MREWSRGAGNERRDEKGGGDVTSAEKKKIALLLVDHGSRFRGANDLLADVAAMVQQLSGLEKVYYCHMELAEPTVAEGFAACVKGGATAVVVHPYFLSPGRHSTTDIPRMVAEAAQAFPGVEYCVTEPLGVHPKIGEVILERAGVPRGFRKLPQGAGQTGSDDGVA
jgi:sirohydrochlorin ferrochelatase